MQDLPKVPFSFQQFVKYPVYGICFLLIIYFVYKEFVETNAYKTENARLRLEVQQYKASQDALTNALLISRGINIQQAIEKKVLDSTIREKLGDKAKQIIGGK
ncbi:hypothetical protein [Pedobacter panaciterrae]